MLSKLSLLIASILAFTSLALAPKEEQKEISVMINDGGLRFEIITCVRTVDLLLEEANIVLKEKDVVVPEGGSEVLAGMQITIQRAIPVKLSDMGGEGDYFTQAKTVIGFFEENNILLDEKDKIYPPENQEIYPDLFIEITRVAEKETTKIVEIDYKTITKENPELKYGRTNILQSGKKGTKKQLIAVVYENGEIVSQKVLEEEILEKPIPKIIEKGTKIVIGRVQEGIASWYKFKGGMFAASNVFPRGTYVRVTSIITGETFVVQINDWGPDPAVHPDRVIDLDAVAFKKLASLWEGTTPVRVEEIL